MVSNSITTKPISAGASAHSTITSALNPFTASSSSRPPFHSTAIKAPVLAINSSSVMICNTKIARQRNNMPRTNRMPRMVSTDAATIVPLASWDSIASGTALPSGAEPPRATIDRADLARSLLDTRGFTKRPPGHNPCRRRDQQPHQRQKPACDARADTTSGIDDQRILASRTCGIADVGPFAAIRTTQFGISAAWDRWLIGQKDVIGRDGIPNDSYQAARSSHYQRFRPSLQA